MNQPEVTLTHWREMNRYNRPQFLGELAKHGIHRSVQTLYNWEAGNTEPDLAALKAIGEITRGQVKPESFLPVRAMGEESIKEDRDRE